MTELENVAMGGWSLSNTAALPLVVLAIMFALQLVETILYRLKVPDTASRQRELSLEVAHLKRQAALLNTPETFAQCAKAERKAIALERELSQLQKAQAAARSDRLLRLPQLLRFGLLALLVGRSLLGRSSAVVAWLQPWEIWPLGRWLSLWTGQPRGVGAVGLVPWALLCQRVAGAVLGRR